MTATAGNTQATVSFTAPSNNGGGAITGYTVTSSPTGGIDSNAGTTSLTHTITGLANGTAYTFTVRATNAVGAGLVSNASISVTHMASQSISFGTTPTIVVGGTGTVSATATSGLSVSYSTTTSSVCTVSGTTVTGIAVGICTIAANQVGNTNYNAATQTTQSITVGPAPTTTTTTTTTTTVATTTTTTKAPTMTSTTAPTTTTASTTTSTVATTTTTTQLAASSLSYGPGWNLLGNGSETPIDVATAFSDTNHFQTVWKWVAAQSTWAFYAPALAAQGDTTLADFVTPKGYQLLTTIAGGEDFWVNAKQAGSINIPTGTVVSSSSFQGMTSGWKLIAMGNTQTASGFNTDMSASPPTARVIPQNITSLWAWENATSKWYFYAPSLESQGGTELSDYITSKGYLNFTTANKTLGPGVGFWVNKQ